VKVLSSAKPPRPGTTLLRVQDGTILTPYLGPLSGRRVLLCVDGQVISPDDAYFTQFVPDEANNTEDVKDTTEHYVGILEAADEELKALREAGYTIYDLRQMSLAQFFKDKNE